MPEDTVIEPSVPCPSIRQKTTPTHTFTFPFDTSILQTIEITYQQGHKNKIVKTTDDGSVSTSGFEAVVTLTQEETLLLDYHIPVRIQVCILTQAGDALTSNIICTTASEVLNSQILGD